MRDKGRSKSRIEELQYETLADKATKSRRKPLTAMKSTTTVT